MAINNSYKDNSPRDFHFLKSIVGEAYPQTMGIGLIDSTDMAAVEVLNAVQRAGTNIVDVSGKLYRTVAATIDLDTLKYSILGDSGPFTEVTILIADPAFVWPVGDGTGQPFNLPMEFASNPGASLWWETKGRYYVLGPFNDNATLTNDIAAYWKLDTDTPVDSLGNHDFAKGGSGTTRVAGKINDCYNFSGYGYLTVADHADFNNDDFAFGVWVNDDATPGTWDSIFSKAGAGWTTGYSLYWTGSVFSFWTTSYSLHKIDFSLGAAGWHYVVCHTYQSGGTQYMEVWVDNVSKGTHSYSGSMAKSGTALRLASEPAGTYIWQGKLDEVGFWKRALTAPERTALWNSSSGLTY